MNDRIIRALRGEPVDRPPVWFMRQAGRYLPEYREVRSKHAFLEVCETPELALEVTLQPLRRFELDAAIVFSDILPVLTAIGRSWDLVKGKGPVIHQPFRDPSELSTLVRPDVAEALPHVPATIRLFREAKPDTPILGFAGSPFTLLCYLVEGGSSKDWTRTKRLLWEEPETADAVLGLLADVVGDYLQSQVDAGAAAVQMFDTWAGALSPAMWERWAGKYATRALARVSGAPRLYFTRDTSPFLSRLHQTGADAFGLDWRVDVREARKALGAETPVQGNLDPIALYAPAADIKAQVHAICDAAGPVGHVFNLGHGVTPTTPIDGVHAMIEAVHERKNG